MNNAPFLLSCMLDDFESVKYFLLERKSDNLINQKNQLNNKTGLHFACENDSVELVKFLLSFDDIILNEKDLNGMTPLDYALKNNNEAIIQLFTEKGG